MRRKKAAVDVSGRAVFRPSGESENERLGSSGKRVVTKNSKKIRLATPDSECEKRAVAYRVPSTCSPTQFTCCRALASRTVAFKCSRLVLRSKSIARYGTDRVSRPSGPRRPSPFPSDVTSIESPPHFRVQRVEFNRRVSRGVARGSRLGIGAYRGGNHGVRPHAGQGRSSISARPRRPLFFPSDPVIRRSHNK